MSLEGQIEDTKADGYLNMDSKVTIEYLNNDCLMHIFSYLSIQNRLKMELVCKRWCEAAKLSWNHFHNLDLYAELPHKEYKDLKKNETFIINVFNRCGSYLHKLGINRICYEILKSSAMWKNLLENCNNVKSLSIEDSNTNLFTKDEIRSLLGCFNACNLTSLCLSSLELEGNFLPQFFAKHSSTLEKLSINFCSFKNCKYFDYFLSQLKNLSNLEITHYSESDVEEIVTTLTKYQIYNISEISIEISEDKDYLPSVYGISKFMTKQNKLTKFKLQGNAIEKELMDNLPVSLEILNLCGSIFQNYKLLYTLNRLQNLKIFSCFVGDLNHFCLQAICKSLYKNIKEINIEYLSYMLKCKETINCLRKFENLESFSIQGALWNDDKRKIDNLLEGLSKCFSIRKITIIDCNFSNLGLKRISSLPFLNSLRILDHNPLTDENYNDFIRNTLSLKELIVCDNIKYLK